MEIISFVAQDGFTHYIFNPTMGIPFFFWIILLSGCISLVHLILKKIVG